MRNPLPEKYAQDIYEILIKTCGAPESGLLGRDYFVQSQTREFISEFRFQGSLGFGGKFWRNGGRWYVNCYPEDETLERAKAIEEANVELAALRKKFESSQ